MTEEARPQGAALDEPELGSCSWLRQELLGYY